MSVTAEHCLLMSQVGKFADTEWAKNGSEIAGQTAFEAVHLVSVDMSHPPLPIFAYWLGLLPVAANGASVDLWGSPDPLCLCILNVNHSQTRKSRLTSQAEGLSSHIDSWCSKVLVRIWEAKLKALNTISAAKKRKRSADSPADSVPAGESLHETDPDDERIAPFPGAFSVAFLGGTIERVRERCAGDCPVVKQSRLVQRLPGLYSDAIDRECPGLNTAERAMAASAGMNGRIWFGQGLVYDEVYGFLQDISILDKPCEKKASDGPGSGQTPLAGWFNRLVQSGKSDHETKSNGAHGGLDCQPVSVTLLGNFHPTPAIEMLRGERGDHGCQAKARLIVVTGSPVQPHEPYDEVGGLACKFIWVPIPTEIHSSVGLGSVCRNIHTFRDFVKCDADEEEGLDDGEAPDQPIHVPSAEGHMHTLPDGVEVPIRMVLVAGRYRVEWCLPDRKVDIPDDHNIAKRMPAFIAECALMAHRKISLTDAARGAFLSYQTMYNIKVATARAANDADNGAEYGIAPWKLGQLSACLLLWDILWGVKRMQYREQAWEVEIGHIQRANLLMAIFDGIREGIKTKTVADEFTQNEAMHCLAGDRDLPGCPSVRGTKTTEIVRRLLFKSTAGADPTHWVCPCSKSFQAFTRKEFETVGKMTSAGFRNIAKVCPPIIGHFDATGDMLMFEVPDEPSDEWKAALLGYANTSASALRDTLRQSGARGGRRRGDA
jgi:hypothetical protein